MSDKKSTLHPRQRYDGDGAGTITILMAILTLGIIAFSIFARI